MGTLFEFVWFRIKSCEILWKFWNEYFNVAYFLWKQFATLHYSMRKSRPCEDMCIIDVVEWRLIHVTVCCVNYDKQNIFTIFTFKRDCLLDCFWTCMI